MLRRMAILFCCLVSAVAASPSSGTTRFVSNNAGHPCNGTPCYQTVKAAVDASTAGDTVLVRPGTYPERAGLSSSILVDVNNLTLMGEVGLERETILDGDTTGVVVAPQGDDCDDETTLTRTARFRILDVRPPGFPGPDSLIGIRIENLTFRNGRTFSTSAYGNGDSRGGGAVQLYKSSGLIRLCRFERNVAWGYNSGHGGALSWYGDPIGILGAQPSGSIDSCYFEFNDGGYYGGAAIIAHNARIDVLGSVFYKNGHVEINDGCYMDGCSRGGALSYTRTGGKVHRNVFWGNRCRHSGGALSIVRGGSWPEGLPTPIPIDVRFNTFYADTTGIPAGPYSGSAIQVIHIDSTQKTNFTLRNNVFANCVGYRSTRPTSVVAHDVPSQSTYTFDDGCNNFWQNLWFMNAPTCVVASPQLDSTYFRGDSLLTLPTCGGGGKPSAFCDATTIALDPLFVARKIGDFALRANSACLDTCAQRMGAYGEAGSDNVIASITNPSGSSVWKVGESRSITWSLAHCNTPVPVDSVHLWLENGRDTCKVRLRSLVASYSPTGCSGSTSWNWEVTYPVGDSNWVYVQALPHSGPRIYGGESARFTIAENSCPVVDTWAGESWMLENSILARSMTESMTTDTYKLREEPQVAGGRYRLRIWENANEFTTLDAARLRIIDHVPGVEVFGSDESFVLGTREPAARVTRASGEDITELLTRPGGGAFLAGPGETLLVELGGGEGAMSHLPSGNSPMDEEGGGVFSLGGKEMEERPDLPPGPESTHSLDERVLSSTGVFFQVRRGEEEWQTVRTIYPRQEMDEFWISDLGTDVVRLVLVGRHRVGFVGRMVSAGMEAAAQTAELLVGQHSRLGSVAGAVSDAGGASILIARGDTLTLEYAASSVPEGKVRSWFLSTRGVYSSTAPEDQDEMEPTPVLSFSLGGACPNPVVAGTTIRYALARDSALTIRIYDVAGRLTRTLLRARQPAGHHEIEWDTKDDAGRRLGSGVYFYRMDADDWHEERKLVVLGQ